MSETPETEPARAGAVAFAATAVALVVTYYATILLHEWGHGTVAWLLGHKSSPFDIVYGGWLLLHPDEAVSYADIIEAGQGAQAAAIGISGYVVNVALAIVSLVVLTLWTPRSPWWRSLWYWLATMNLMAVYGYTPEASFTRGGDIGWLVRGLEISAWFPFVVGTLLVSAGILRLLRYEVPSMYACLPIRTITIRRIYLWVTLGVLFLLLYVHGFNPATGAGMGGMIRAAGWITLALVPTLAVVCDPSRAWVRALT